MIPDQQFDGIHCRASSVDGIQRLALCGVIARYVGSWWPINGSAPAAPRVSVTWRRRGPRRARRLSTWRGPPPGQRPGHGLAWASIERFFVQGLAATCIHTDEQLRGPGARQPYLHIDTGAIVERLLMRSMMKGRISPVPKHITLIRMSASCDSCPERHPIETALACNLHGQE